MIDEELYQQATDELNSDRRQQNIWARACALSKDDHDEARYLYTNLRVVELIAERDSRSGTADDASGNDYNATLAMSPDMDMSSKSTLPLDDTSDVSADATLVLADIASNSNDSEMQFDDNPFSAGVADTSPTLSSVEREYYEKHPEQLKELEESNFTDTLQRSNKDLDSLLDGIDDANFANASNVLADDYSDATSTQAVFIEDGMDWPEKESSISKDPVGEDQTSLQPVSPPMHAAEEDTDRFTQDLLRQADELPGQHSDLVGSEGFSAEENTWEPSSRANEAVVGTAAAIGASRYGNVSEKNESGRSNATRLPIDLRDGKTGTEYTVFRRDQKVQAVKRGVSWSALFFTVPYLIYRHMVGTAIVYAIMSLIVAAGFILCGLNWMDAGASATDMIKIATVGFGLLALIGILYLPFRHGNSWRSEKLERRGFELIAHVKARNPGKAVALARRASALD